MKTQDLFIILGSPDDQVEQSARGLLYKYMMNGNATRIYVYRFNSSAASATLIISAVKVESAWQIIDECSDTFTGFAQEHLDTANRLQSPNDKVYKTGVREHGAIIVCHGSSIDIDGLAPELFAQALIKVTTANYSTDTPTPGKPFPVFSKIVFNACRVGEIVNDKSQLPNSSFWKEGKQVRLAVTGSRKPVAFNTAQFSEDIAENKQQKHEAQELQQSQGLSYDYDPDLLTRAPLKEQLVLNREFSCIFRFLNIYGRKFDSNVIVAGYDDPITAADTLKPSPKQTTPLSADEKFRLSGRKMLLKGLQPIGWVSDERSTRKLHYKLTASQGAVRAEISLASWSEWTDQVV